MSFAERIAALLWTLDFGVRRRTEAELRRFAQATEQFVRELLEAGPPSDWRERLTAHLEYWRHQGPGFTLKNRDVLEQYIVDWIAGQRPKTASDWRQEIAPGPHEPLEVERPRSRNRDASELDDLDSTARSSGQREMTTDPRDLADIEAHSDASPPIPSWKAYELESGGKQTIMETFFEGATITVRLDRPPSTHVIVDFKDYNWSNPRYRDPFIRSRLIEKFTKQIKTYQTIRPHVRYRFSLAPPDWAISPLHAAGATYCVIPRSTAR